MAHVLGRAYEDYFNYQRSQRHRPLPKSHGLWCPACRMSHPYNGNKKLGIQFEHRNSQLVILWLCPHTKTVLGERS
jgi:hypothetical protein